MTKEEFVKYVAQFNTKYTTKDIIKQAKKVDNDE